MKYLSFLRKFAQNYLPVLRDSGANSQYIKQSINRIVFTFSVQKELAPNEFFNEHISLLREVSLAIEDLFRAKKIDEATTRDVLEFFINSFAPSILELEKINDSSILIHLSNLILWVKQFRQLFHTIESPEKALQRLSSAAMSVVKWIEPPRTLDAPHEASLLAVDLLKQKKSVIVKESPSFSSESIESISDNEAINSLLILLHKEIIKIYMDFFSKPVNHFHFQVYLLGMDKLNIDDDALLQRAHLYLKEGLVRLRAEWEKMSLMPIEEGAEKERLIKILEILNFFPPKTVKFSAFWSSDVIQFFAEFHNKFVLYVIESDLVKILFRRENHLLIEPFLFQFNQNSFPVAYRHIKAIFKLYCHVFATFPKYEYVQDLFVVFYVSLPRYKTQLQLTELGVNINLGGQEINEFLLFSVFSYLGVKQRCTIFESTYRKFFEEGDFSQLDSFMHLIVMAALGTQIHLPNDTWFNFVDPLLKNVADGGLYDFSETEIQSKLDLLVYEIGQISSLVAEDWYRKLDMYNTHIQTSNPSNNLTAVLFQMAGAGRRMAKAKLKVVFDKK